MLTKEELETIMADRELLNQYKKELTDLKNRTGLAKVMSETEIKAAIKMIKVSINDMEKYLNHIAL